MNSEARCVDECASAVDLVAAYRSRVVSPVEITRAAFARLARDNPGLNALYLLDEEGALASARESEARWLRGEPCGLLDGVPTTAKDAVLTRGFPIYRGSAVHNPGGEICQEDAPAIARLREAGAVILGKTTMPDYGLLASGYSSRHGITRNPWSPAHNCGGSSSGAAVAVACGVTPVAVGTDIVGSIRIPAAFCGLVGLKPGRGRVPYYFPNSPSLVAGPLARTAADAALLMNVISRPDPRDFTALPYDGFDYLSALESAPRKGRIGVLEAMGFGVEPVPEVIARLESLVRTLAAEGFALTRLASPFKTGEDAFAEHFYRVRVLSEMKAVADEHWHRVPVISGWIRPAMSLDAVDLYRCEVDMLRIAEKAAALLTNCDYVLLPTYPGEIFSAEAASPDPERPFAPWCNTFPFNLADLPAISIPCGFTRAGLPVGMQIVGKRFDEAGLLGLAHLIGRTRPLERPWPFS